MKTNKKEISEIIENCNEYSSEIREFYSYKDRYKQVFNNTNIANAIITLDNYIIIEVNESFERIIQMPKDDILGNDVNICKKLNRNINFDEIKKKLIDENTQYSKIVHFDNDEKGSFCNLIAIRININFTPHILLSLIDISEKYETEQKYQNLLNNAPLGILYTDNNGNIDYVNSLMLGMLGSPSAEETKKINMLTSERIKKAGISNIYKECIETKKKSILELPYTSKWGKSVYVRFYISPTFSDDNLSGVLVMAEDITGIVEAQEKEKKYKDELLEMNRNLEIMVKERTQELNKAKEKAEESDRLKTAFLANMSHEIRTPMNAIIGFTEIISKPNIPITEKQKYISYINQSGKTLVKLIDDIIDISKIEANQMKIKKKNFNVKDLFSELFQIFKKQLVENNKANVKMVLNADENNSIIYSDELRLRQIVSNLLNNAVKFTQKGEIEFGYKINDDKLSVFVKDTGDGIDADIIDNVFDRFVRTEKLNKKGTGIGLSIVKSLTELLEGKINVESEIGKGTLFELEFFNTKIVAMEDEEINNEKTYDWNNKTILVAEDDMFNLIILEETLKETNVNIITVENGLEAVAKFKENKHIIDIVLMDIQMPKLDGFEASKQILKFDNTAKIIAQTAYANKEENDKIAQIGCVDVITKPIENDLFFATIDKYI